MSLISCGMWHGWRHWNQKFPSAVNDCFQTKRFHFCCFSPGDHDHWSSLEGSLRILSTSTGHISNHMTAILISKLLIIWKYSLPAFSEGVRRWRMFSVVRSSWNKQINQKYLPLPQHLYRKKVLLVPQPILKPLIEIKRLWIWLEREDL